MAQLARGEPTERSESRRSSAAWPVSAGPMAMRGSSPQRQLDFRDPAALRVAGVGFRAERSGSGRFWPDALVAGCRSVADGSSGHPSRLPIAADHLSARGSGCRRAALVECYRSNYAGRLRPARLPISTSVPAAFRSLPRLTAGSSWSWPPLPLRLAGNGRRPADTGFAG